MYWGTRTWYVLIILSKGWTVACGVSFLLFYLINMSIFYAFFLKFFIVLKRYLFLAFLLIETRMIDSCLNNIFMMNWCRDKFVYLVICLLLLTCHWSWFPQCPPMSTWIWSRTEANVLLSSLWSHLKSQYIIGEGMDQL